MKYFWLFLFVFGCETNPFYVSFLQEMEARGVEPSKKLISIEIVDAEQMISIDGKPSFIEALCYEGKITINKFEWDIKPDCKKEILVYHELGHCLLNKTHSENPNSIMYKYSNLDCDYYLEHRTELLDELFLGGDL